MGSSKKQTTGYRYFFGIHMGLSRGPVDEIIEIRVGDKMVWQGNMVDSSTVSINAPDVFGGDKREGGVVGTFNLMMGKPDQVAAPGLVSMIGRALPGFRKMCTAFFNGQIASNSPYPKPWKMRMRRSMKGWQNDAPWYPEKARIILDGQPLKQGDENVDTKIHAMNPAHIIYECLTNSEWGRGLPASALNVASFTQAADTLFEEGFGLCLRWTRRENLQAFIQTVIDHIGAAIYADRETATITLKLIRFDYEPTTLPIYTTDSGILEIKEAESSALGPAVNEVVVEYVDPVTGETRTVNQQNLASLQASRGVFNSLKKSYPGLPTNGLARRVGQRDLRINAMSLRRFKITMDRRAWRIAPASVFRLSDVVRGVGEMVVRVGAVEDGTLTNGTITITAVQDVFSLPTSSFIGNEPPNWVQPNTKPELKEHRAFELPYFLIRAGMSPADFDYLAPDAGFIGTVVAKPTDLSLAYDLYVKNGPPEEEDYPPGTAPNP